MSDECASAHDDIKRYSQGDNSLKSVNHWEIWKSCVQITPLALLFWLAVPIRQGASAPWQATNAAG